MTRIITLLFLFLYSYTGFAQMPGLSRSIREITKDKQLELGITLCDLNSGDTLSILGTKHFPMQSVYKFPIALAVLNKVDKNELCLTDSIFIPDSLYKNKLWSPIRDNNPRGNVYLPLSEIINYTVAMSDNIGCDLLLRMIGGPDSANSFIQNLGIDNISILNYETEIQKDWNVQFKNYATPNDMIRLLIKFNAREILSTATHDFLWEVMKNTSTGSFKKKLPESTIVVHKTGSSGYNKQGISAATNNVGIFIPKKGKMIAFAIFITNSTESSDTNYEVISEIARAIYDYYNSSEQLQQLQQ
ncbi:MAG: class A beta-lactamase [Bacteroidales bacterium]